MDRKTLYTITLLLNAWITIMYAIELHNYYSDNYNPDGLRFFTRIVIYDIAYAILLLPLFRKISLRSFLIILGTIILQNLNLGFIESLPLTGLIISGLSLIALFVLLVRPMASRE